MDTTTKADREAGELVLDLARGVVRKHWGPVTHLPGQNRDDLIGEAVLGGLRALPGWDPAGRSLEAYLWERMRWYVADQIRDRGPFTRLQVKRAAERGEMLPWEFSTDRLATTAGDTWEPRGTDAEPGLLDDRSEVTWLLTHLTPRQRDVVERYYWGGETFRQIAGDLGVTESRVCQIHGQALTVMRNKLAHETRLAAA